MIFLETMRYLYPNDIHRKYIHSLFVKFFLCNRACAWKVWKDKRKCFWELRPRFSLIIKKMIRMFWNKRICKNILWIFARVSIENQYFHKYWSIFQNHILQAFLVSKTSISTCKKNVKSLYPLTAKGGISRPCFTCFP